MVGQGAWGDGLWKGGATSRIRKKTEGGEMTDTKVARPQPPDVPANVDGSCEKLRSTRGGRHLSVDPEQRRFPLLMGWASSNQENP